MGVGVGAGNWRRGGGEEGEMGGGWMESGGKLKVVCQCRKRAALKCSDYDAIVGGRQSEAARWGTLLSSPLPLSTRFLPHPIHTAPSPRLDLRLPPLLPRHPSFTLTRHRNYRDYGPPVLVRLPHSFPPSSLPLALHALGGPLLSPPSLPNPLHPPCPAPHAAYRPVAIFTRNYPVACKCPSLLPPSLSHRGAGDTHP